MIRTALAPDPAERYASCAAMIEALEHACRLEGWDASTAAVVRLMTRLFGVQTPAVEVADPTQPVVMLPRRFARGTESDVSEDDAPTRGRRSLSRMWSPLAA